MQTTVGQQVLPPQTGRALSRLNTIKSTDAVQTTRLGIATGIVALWREAWLACVAHALPMLGFALIGGVGGVLVGSTVFALGQPWLIIANAVAGMLILSFARGGISALALQGEDASVNFVAACHATFARLPALMIGSCVYASLITTGAVGLGLALRYTRIHVPLSFRGAQRYMLDLQTHEFVSNATQSFVAHSARALIPDPGAPFSAWLPELRTTVLLREVNDDVNRYSTTRIVGNAYRYVSIFTPEQQAFWWITTSSAALLLISEVLLRLRTVQTMKSRGSQNPTGFGWLTPLTDSVQFGLKNFGLIALHVWLLRLAVFVFSVLFIIVPVVLMQEIVLPKVMFALPWTWVWLSAQSLIPQATALCLTLVSAMFATFGAAYDARLYLLLATRADTVVVCHAKSPQVSLTPSVRFLPRKARLGSAAYPS